MLLAVAWGIVAAMMALTNNWKQLAGVRFVLGFVESGFAPGIAFYLSSWYRPYELASLFAVYYTAVAVAGGLFGILAGVITEYLDGARGIAGWRWPFTVSERSNLTSKDAARPSSVVSSGSSWQTRDYHTKGKRSNLD
ncbi:putative metabolite transport protein NicT [Talaromyces pinophilus]|nr:putative metabolite transport protein NicT [Talaromyces pinophilus]